MNLHGSDQRLGHNKLMSLDDGQCAAGCLIRDYVWAVRGHAVCACTGRATRYMNEKSATVHEWNERNVT